MTNIQFKWRGSIYECTDLWNKEFNTDYDYRVFKANEFRHLIAEGHYAVVEQRLHGIGDEKIDKDYFEFICKRPLKKIK